MRYPQTKLTEQQILESVTLYDPREITSSDEISVMFREVAHRAAAAGSKLVLAVWHDDSAPTFGACVMPASREVPTPEQLVRLYKSIKAKQGMAIVTNGDGDASLH